MYIVILYILVKFNLLKSQISNKLIIPLDFETLVILDIIFIEYINQVIKLIY